MPEFVSTVPVWAWLLILNLACGCAAAFRQLDELEMETPRGTRIARALALLVCATLGVLLYLALRIVERIETRGLYTPPPAPEPDGRPLDAGRVTHIAWSGGFVRPRGATQSETRVEPGVAWPRR